MAIKPLGADPEVAFREYFDSSEFTQDLKVAEDALTRLSNDAVGKPQFKRWIEDLQSENKKSKVLKLYKEMVSALGEFDAKFEALLEEVEKFDD